MALIDRLRTTRLDAALALAFVAVSLVQVVWKPIAAPGLGELYVVGSMLPFAWRRTRPVEAALVSSAFWLIPLDGYPVLGGRLVRHQRQQSEALAELAAQLREEQRRVEEVAVDAERARIAQELHDVVGHEVTLIAVQAEAAASALRTSPERAAEPVEAIRTTAHRTLAEIRGVLELLAPNGDTGGATSDGLAELAQRAETAGIANSLEITGRPWPDNAPAVLAVNRIVRECLTNAGRHAPGRPVELCVAWTPRHVEIRSTNAVTASRNGVVPGRGLTGIRHRAELLGGTFRAGVRAGHFEVEVSLPAQLPEGRR
jgi:signal transduction histidine kinase